MKQVIKSLYGGVGLLRGKCPKCNKIAIILDKEYQCCGLKSTKPKKEIIKRLITGQERRFQLPRTEKNKILNKQKHKCIYCEVDLIGSWYMSDTMKRPRKVTIHFDHFIPWCYSRTSLPEEFIVSCNYCNMLKGSKFFEDINEAQTYILKKRIQKGILVI